MAFPTSPVNGQEATVNGITYQYASATNSWIRVAGSATALTVTGNITGGNVITGGQLTAAGNIVGTANITGGNIITAGIITSVGNIYCDTGHYFIGNGSQLTGISGGGGGGSSISNGGSNIGVLFNGNATVGIAGILTATFGPDYLTLSGTDTPGFYSQVKNSEITSNVTLPTNRSIMSIAPFVINSGAVVTIPDSTTLTVLT